MRSSLKISIYQKLPSSLTSSSLLIITHIVLSLLSQQIFRNQIHEHRLRKI